MSLPNYLNFILQIDGEARFTIPLAHIKQSSHNLQSRSIVVEANVTESLNKITLNGDGTVKFYRDAVKLEFLKSNPTTFKPGLPYTAYVRYFHFNILMRLYFYLTKQ